MELTEITRYFPELSGEQQRQLGLLPQCYTEWNSRINVVSRKDIDALEVHHILHSLAIAKCFRFAAGDAIIDIGTGGGFPGIPLAVLFPECRFTLVDSIAKKIKVVAAVTETLGLQNVTPLCSRAEQLTERFDVVVSRAVASLPVFIDWALPLLKPSSAKKPPHGIVYLKGGDVTTEIAETMAKLPKQTPTPNIFDIKQWFDNEFFETKKIIYFAC
ncbi:MAG: 16S rRNA (guanine(527)-N(7))-methyltransferase RsmG [Prevotellaceae bacterium]|jgi:16S rRNA (guanine527-N7)-methyltransferase|nr:16S rRNA (guanine(527)-N(7))-methyltransferase RsmG [Prevotellaceae bacterium]